MYRSGVLYALTTEHGEIDAFDLSDCTNTRNVIVGKLKDFIYESVYIIPAPWGWSATSLDGSRWFKE